MKTLTLNKLAKQTALADIKNDKANDVPLHLIVRKPSYLVVLPLDVIILDALLDQI